jgi:hypothetical protein
MASQSAENNSDESGESPPDGITSEHFVAGALGIYRGFLPLALLGVLLAVALTGVLGGARNPVVLAQGDAATLKVTAPQILRNGTFFELDIAVDAHRPISEPVIAISRTYLKDMTINTHLPEPVDMDFEGDAFTLTYPAIEAGGRLRVKMDGQVNPPLIGRNMGTIELRDGETPIAELPVALRILP